MNEETEHTAAMNTTPHNQRIAELLRNKTLLRASDLDAVGVPRVVLSRMIASGQLQRVGRGLYRQPEAALSEHDSLVAVAARVPQAVFCLLTALQFHDLTSQLPRAVWITMPRGSHQPKLGYPPLRMVQASGAAYAAGVETVQRDRVTLRLFSPAKTVADCFKHRNTIGLDVAIEALKDFRLKHRDSADELWHYAKICRVANVMRPYLEATE